MDGGQTLRESGPWWVAKDRLRMVAEMSMRGQWFKQSQPRAQPGTVKLGRADERRQRHERRQDRRQPEKCRRLLEEYTGPRLVGHPTPNLCGPYRSGSLTIACSLWPDACGLWAYKQPLPT